MELRQFPIALIMIGIIISGSFIFMSDIFNHYGVTNNINNTALGDIAHSSEQYRINSTNTYNRIVGGSGQEEASTFGLIDMMVFGVYRTLVFTASSIGNFFSMAFDLSSLLPFGSSMIGTATFGLVSIMFVILAFLIANAVFKWRI